MKILLPVLTASIAALAANAAPAQLVQLKSGDTLLGRIDPPDENGFTLHRLDNGGVLQLRWDHLSPESATRLKQQFNMAWEEEGEVLVRAVSVRYEIAGVLEQLVGRVVDDGDERQITVRRQGIDYPIQRSALRAMDPVEVPATEVYARSDFYAEKLGEYSPGDDAKQHIALADILLRVRDYEHAELHLAAAAENDDGSLAATIEGKQRRLARFKESAREAELLDQIRVWLERRKFDKGLAAIAQFEEQFPDSKLASEFAHVVRRFHRARDKALVAEVTRLWDKEIWTLARQKATDASVDFESAKSYAEGQMGAEIREAVRKKLDLEADVVDEMWTKRLESRGAGERYHYGVGSWTLGRDAIRKGTSSEEQEVQIEVSAEQKAAERAKRRVREAQERAKRSAGARGAGESIADTPEQWWRKAGSDARAAWLRAYYVEFGGDLEVRAAFLDNCAQCGATGHTITYGQSGDPQKVKCATCQGTQFKRWIRAH